MIEREENKTDIGYDHFAVKDFDKSKSEGKTVYQKEEYGKALKYAYEKLSEFQEVNKLKLPLIFRHEKLMFERGELPSNDKAAIKKCWDFVDELNEDLTKILNE